MALSNERIIARGVTPHVHEREAVDFAIAALPDREPFRLWALVDLVDRSGRRYDLDLVVIGYTAVYLVEIKSHPGVFSGDVVDWRVDFHGGGVTSLDNPLKLTAHKARVLASMLDRTYRGKGRRPHVQELVFLSAPNVEVKLEGAAAHNVVTRETFERAITFGEYPGSDLQRAHARIDKPTARETKQALERMGLRESLASRKVHDLVLQDVLVDRQTYQDHAARNERLPDIRARVRTYQIAEGTTPERREALVRAAEREARTLTMLSDHPGVLELKSYVPEGPTGAPCIVFEDFDGGVPLDAFLRAHPDLSLHAKTGLLQSLAEALAYCHRKGVMHRGLAPSAVLVRQREDHEVPELRLLNFQLSATPDATSSGTAHLSHWYASNEDVYVAPEVLEKASNASRASDVFSLGALAYLVLTGQAPGTSLSERASLMKPGYLSLATARDDLSAGVAPLTPDGTPQDDLETVMQFATALHSIDREEDALAWVNVLLEALTAPAPPEHTEYVDPLLARPGDEIAKGMEVKAVLGTGSTARTLRVKTAEGVSALKVALSADMDDRIAREAQVLKVAGQGPTQGSGESPSDRIVRLYEELTVGGRACLRLTDAGHSLAHELAEKGAQSLDFARRWGEDLLLALSHLEDKGVQHRDIKPGNLGVLTSANKKKRHLLLFDFSLSSIPAQDIRAGTEAYRDPFLRQRGCWDDAADRYAAALTLHELLTGDRPRWGKDDIASATDEPITLAAERFDASVRERLVQFFQRALARDVADRFDSVEAMRTAWMGCFSTLPSARGAADEPNEPEIESAQPEVEAALPEGLTLDTAVEALPLDAGAKNALYRAGTLTVRALLELPDNQLSAMRRAGVGNATVRSILRLRDRPELQALRASAQPADAFFPEYQGPATEVQVLAGLPSEANQRLRQAGLADLSLVAQCPSVRLRHVLEGDESALSVLQEALQSGQAQRDASDSSLGALLDVLLPSPKKRGDKPLTHVRALFGLDPLKGTFHESVQSVAEAAGVTTALLYIQLGKLRERWAQSEVLGELHGHLEAALQPTFGILRLDQAARALAQGLGEEPPEDGSALPENLFRAARALVRVALETHAGFKLGRVGDVPWVLPIGVDPKAIAALGALADTLAAADPLLSPGAVQERLARHVSADEHGDTGLGQVPHHALVALAASASSKAAKSARLELYPRGLAAQRALDLCVGALPAAKLSPELLAQIVAARYPEAAPLPALSELRSWMEARGYAWDAATQTFARKRRANETGTEALGNRAPTTHTGHRVAPDPDAHQFAQDVAVRLKRGSFCVLEATPAYAADVARELHRRHGLTPRSLERLLLQQMRSLMTELEVDAQLVFRTDRQGNAAPDWPNLRELMEQAAARVLDTLREQAEPLVLTDPGLLARYQLDAFVQGLMARAKEDDAHAIFLIVPAAEEAGGPRITHPDGDLPLPLTSPAQRLRVPKAWLNNLDRAAS